MARQKPTLEEIWLMIVTAQFSSQQMDHLRHESMTTDAAVFEADVVIAHLHERRTEGWEKYAKECAERMKAARVERALTKNSDGSYFEDDQAQAMPHDLSPMADQINDVFGPGSIADAFTKYMVDQGLVDG